MSQADPKDNGEWSSTAPDDSKHARLAQLAQQKKLLETMPLTEQDYAAIQRARSGIIVQSLGAGAVGALFGVMAVSGRNGRKTLAAAFGMAVGLCVGAAYSFGKGFDQLATLPTSFGEQARKFLKMKEDLRKSSISTPSLSDADVISNVYSKRMRTTREKEEK